MRRSKDDSLMRARYWLKIVVIALFYSNTTIRAIQDTVASREGADYYSSMTEHAWRERLISYIREQAKPADRFSHQARLYRLAVSLAGGDRFDDDVVFAAAWIHDLGVFIGHRPEDPEALRRWDHLVYVLQKGPQILEHVGFSVDKIPAAMEAVRTHMPGAMPTTFEAQLLRDADILEQLGAVGILRTVGKVGRDTRFTRFSDALRVLQKNADELPGKLQLRRSEHELKSRLKLLHDFLAAAEYERAGTEW